MRHVVNSVIFAALLAALSMAGERSSAKEADYDGNWTVLVITEKGTCDRGYRYGVRVANGQVNYRGEKSVDLSGTITPNGEVRVSIRFHDQSASGVGRLSPTDGTGSWHGTGSSGTCSGRWEAERR